MSPAKKEDGRARFLIALFAVLGIGLLVIPFLLVPPASLEIAVRDGLFGLDLKGPAVLQLGEGDTITIPLRKEGAQFLASVKRVPSGTGSLRLEVPGYRAEPLSYEVAPLATARLAKDLVPTFGRLDLSVVDARDADRPVEATVTEDKKAVPPGANPYQLPAGKHTVVAHNEAFCDGTRTVQIKEGETIQETLPLSPKLTGDQIARVILDWGENPSDLDAHLDLADSPDAGSSAHVFFVNKRGVSAAGQVLAELDVDQQQSEGFETVTVYNRTTGTYRYLVHLYAGNGTLGGSKATVEVLTKDCARQVYKVPETCQNRWWYVADIKLDDTGATVAARGECLTEPPTSWRTRRK